MLRNKKGFTLIELMVVIVIIGILAALAIPRFTEASAKAKMAEAPRILASYESAQQARVAETGSIGKADEIVFEVPSASESKWWTYSAPTDAGVFTATPVNDIGKFLKTYNISTNYNTTTKLFDHKANSAEAVAQAQKYIPNFSAGT